MGNGAESSSSDIYLVTTDEQRFPYIQRQGAQSVGGMF